MAFGQPQRKMPRILGPRVVIYLIVLLAFAWVMWRYDQHVQAAKTTMIPQAAPAIAPEKQSRLPMVVLVASPGDDLEALYQEIAKNLDGRCSVTITSAKDEASEKTLKTAFQTETLPVAILYDAQNLELARVSAPLAADAILAMANAQ